MLGCSWVSSAGTCGAKCGMLDCLWGDLNGKKQQHSVDWKIFDFVARAIWIRLRSFMKCFGWSVKSELEAAP